MKRTVVVSDTPQSVAGIEFFPLEVSITSLDFEEYELKSESRSVYVKVLRTDEVDSIQQPSDAQWYVIDADLPNNTWLRSVEELTQQWLQLKVFFKDLAKLGEEMEILSPGWSPWTVNKALDRWSKTSAALIQIKQISGKLDAEGRWRSHVSDIHTRVESLKEQNKACHDRVQARKNHVDHAIIILTFVSSIVVAIVLAIVLP